MPRHLAFPVHLNMDGNLATNEQGADADIRDSIEIVLVYPRGSRRGSPSFGIPPDLLFDQQPLDMNAITASIASSEPDVEVLASADADIISGVERIRVGYGETVR